VCADVAIEDRADARAFAAAVGAAGWYRCRSGDRTFVQVLFEVDATAAGQAAVARCREALDAVGASGTVAAVRAEDGLLPGGHELRRRGCAWCADPAQGPCATCDDDAVLSRYEALAGGAGAVLHLDLGAAAGVLREVF
jgi:hypothetical protein